LEEIQQLLFGAHKYIVLGITFLVVIALFLDKIKPSIIFFIAGIGLVLTGSVSSGDFFAGLGNRSILTIILLVAITYGLNKSLNIESFFDRAFKRITSPRKFISRVSIYTAFLSSILNNTPIVAVMTPYIYNWAKKHGSHPSKLLIPLSFSTILGGMITVIGTSTNLVLNGFIRELNPDQLLRWDDFFYLGILVTFTGILYLTTVGYRILPAHKEAFNEVQAVAPEYLVELIIARGSKLVGQQVSASGLESLENAYLVELHRGFETVTPIPPDYVLKEDDVLSFMGVSDKILELTNGNLGLALPNDDKDRQIVEVVLPANTRLANRRLNQKDFKKRYDAEVLAVHRNGSRLSGRLEQITLDYGDLLLLSVGPRFTDLANKDLYMLSKIESETEPVSSKNRYIGIGAIPILLALAIGYIDILVAALFFFGLLILLRKMDFRDLGKAVDIDMIVTLVSALALGKAMSTSGAADLISNAFLFLVEPFGSHGLVIGLFILTVLITSFITNVAAVSIVFPLAFTAARQLGIDPTAAYVSIAFAASAAFLTPVSYQTNLMIYGPGGYTNKDFLRVGSPLVLLYGIIVLTFILIRYPS
jgi:di/tricarboxylate transporter